jgi:hypothetical protein
METTIDQGVSGERIGLPGPAPTDEALLAAITRGEAAALEALTSGTAGPSSPSP